MPLDIPDTTVQDKVRFMHAHDATKHGLGSPGQSPEEFADMKINQMTNAELVEAISSAVEERLAECK